MRHLICSLSLSAGLLHAGLTPRFLYSTQMGSTHQAHTTFVKGQPQWFQLQPVWATPITCDHTALTCTTDGTYKPLGTETSVNVLSDNGTMPGYQFGSYSSVTSGGVTTLTYTTPYTGGAPFFAGMVGNQIATGSDPVSGGVYWGTRNYHTVRSYIDSTHITVDAFTEADQVNGPYWYGGLWGQWGCCYTAPYDVCNVSGNTFKLRQHIPGGNCSTEPVQPFVTNGSNLYLVVNTTACYLSPTVTGLPDGSTVTWNNQYGQVLTSPGAPGYELSVCNGQPPLWPEITIPSGAANGTYNAVFRVSQNSDGTGAGSTHTFPINVIDMPALRGSPSSYPPLPNLSNWSTIEKQYLDYFCDTSSGTLTNQGFHAVVNVNHTAITWVSGDQFTSAVNNNVILVNGVTTYPVSTSGTAFIDASHITSPVDFGVHAGSDTVTLSYNSAWDATSGFILGNGMEPIALYYPDGILSYLYGYRRWKDPGYKACANTIADLYAKAVNKVDWPHANGMQYQEVFGWGLYQMWKLTGSSSYATAIDNMARQPCCSHYPAISAALGWLYPFPDLRSGLLGLDLETAWQQVNGAAYMYGPVGGPNQDPMRGVPNNNLNLDRYAGLQNKLASMLLAFDDYPCDGCSLAGQQPFITGTYAAHAIRHIDEISPNDYLLYVAKRTADFLTGWYDLTTAHGFVYNTSYNFVGCAGAFSSDPASYRFGQYNLWFPANNDGNCGFSAGVKAYSDSSLNMAANLWSYVWKNTGIDTYRQYAYDAFAHVTDAAGACCGLGPKQFNQMFGYDGISQIAEDAVPPSTSGCSDLSFSPVSDAVTAKGGSGTILVSVSDPTCQWTASSSAAWLSITSGGSGTGQGAIGWTAAPNPGPLRFATIGAAAAQFTVRQNPPPLRWIGARAVGAKAQ